MLGIFRKKKKELPEPKPPEFYEQSLKSLEEELGLMNQQLGIEDEKGEEKEQQKQKEEVEKETKETRETQELQEAGEKIKQEESKEEKKIEDQGIGIKEPLQQVEVERKQGAILGDELQEVLREKKKTLPNHLFVDVESYDKLMNNFNELGGLINKFSTKWKNIAKHRREIINIKQGIKSQLLELEENILKIEEQIYGG
ncbi:hypothetical protein J7K74_01955 [Candidatus Woesearchaeota archaeon]|nr:hypothetical protein [Candidatus Woesearchaeota archaeon]